MAYTVTNVTSPGRSLDLGDRQIAAGATITVEYLTNKAQQYRSGGLLTVTGDGDLTAPADPSDSGVKRFTLADVVQASYVQGGITYTPDGCDCAVVGDLALIELSITASAPVNLALAQILNVALLKPAFRGEVLVEADGHLWTGDYDVPKYAVFYVNEASHSTAPGNIGCLATSAVTGTQYYHLRFTLKLDDPSLLPT